MWISFNNHDLPDVLSNNEQLELFKRINAGDLNARKLLIESNTRLVLNIVIHQYSNTGEEHDDLMSEGMVGLIKAVDSFDISKNCVFCDALWRG